MFIIKKQVYNWVYYWNDLDHTWEGLADNASLLTSARLDELMKGFLLEFYAHDYSYSKVAA